MRCQLFICTLLLLIFSAPFSGTSISSYSSGFAYSPQLIDNDGGGRGHTLVKRVINGKIVSGGVYIIQSQENRKAILSIGSEDEFEKVAIEGDPLALGVTSLWRNSDEQKWTVKEWGKTYKHFFITSFENTLNNITYRIFKDNFRLKNVYDILDAGDQIVWLIQLYRGKCLAYSGLNEIVGQEKCDAGDQKQQWHFHLLNQ